MTDRTPAIIACMRDMVAERCEKTTYNDENINLFASLDALALAVDSALVFGLWPVTGDDECMAVDLMRAIEGHERPFESNRAVTGAVARRLSEVACALFVQGEDDQMAAWLHTAAGRLIGMTNLRPDNSEPPAEAAVIATLQRKAAMHDATMARLVCLSKPTRDFVSTALGIWEDKR